MKQLTTHNATITTATVEMKTLTISGKQVTLSVFRQLIEAPLIADDGTLNGVPWGAVNYHPDKCGDIADHWHIVWQRGAELRRARVAYRPPTTRYWSKTGDKLISAHVREVLEGRGRYFGGGMPRFDGNGNFTQIWWASFPVEMSRDESLKEAIRAWHDWRCQVASVEKHPGSELYRNSEEGCRARLAREVERLSCAALEPDEVDGLHDDFQDELKAEVARRQRHRDVRAALAELPQLFIAV